MQQQISYVGTKLESATIADDGTAHIEFTADEIESLKGLLEKLAPEQPAEDESEQPENTPKEI